MTDTYKVTARVVATPDTYDVLTTWSGPNLDRTDGIGFGLRNRATAMRLRMAINAGAVFTDPVLKTDVEGNTYVSAGCRVMARYANADLKRLGF